MCKTILNTFGSEYDPIQQNMTNCTNTYGSILGEGGEYPCCLRIFQNETCGAFQSEKALPLQIIAIFFFLIIVIGLPIFFVFLIRNGVNEIQKGGYLMKKTNLENTLKKHRAKIDNIKESQSNDIQKQLGSGKDLDAALKKYAVMGKHDADSEIRAVEKLIQEEVDKLKNLYTKEVLDNPKAQSYLYQPYSYAHRYYKVVTLVQKLVLLMIQLFVPPQIIANLKMIMGSIFVMVGASLASLQQPFSDSMESMMEMSSQITNAINILVGLGIASGIPWLQDWVGNALLFTVNGINISVFLTTLVISPIRNILFAKKFAQMQLQLQARKIEEFTNNRNSREAQRGGRDDSWLKLVGFLG